MTQTARFFLVAIFLWFVAPRPVWGEEVDNSLHSLQLSEGPPEPGFMGHALSGKLPEGKLSLNPGFKPGVDSYTVTVSQPLLTIRARAAAGVKMDVGGTASGGGELSVANRFGIGNANDHGAFLSATLSGLAPGENVITVSVSDSGGTATRSYTVTVARTVTDEKAPLGLDDLQLSEGSPKPGFMFSAMAGKLPEGNLTVAPAFEPGMTSYTANVSQPLVTVRARAAAGVEMRVTGAATGGDELTASNRSRVSNANGIGAFLSVTLSGLTAGKNLVSVEVTDPDGAETRRYNVELTRVGKSAGDTVRSAKATKGRQARNEAQQARVKAREAREKEREAREKERDTRRLEREARKKERVARWKERQARMKDGSKDETGQNLLSSIRNKDADGVRRAMEAGENVNEPFPGRTGASPLLLAVEEENTEIIRLLIDAGADVNYVLPEQGFGSSNTSGVSALLVAVDKGNSEILRLLIDAGADVNNVLPEQKFPSKDATGASALLLAVKAGNETIVRLLIDGGADLNYVLPQQDFHSNSTGGISALLLAVSESQEAIVRLLVQAGADVNCAFPEQKFPARKSTGGVSALILAVNSGHEEIVRLLVEGGADVNYRIPGKRGFGKNPNTAGLTAWRVAKAKDDSGIVKLLKKAGAKP